MNYGCFAVSSTSINPDTSPHLKAENLPAGSIWGFTVSGEVVSKGDCKNLLLILRLCKYYYFSKLLLSLGSLCTSNPCNIRECYPSRMHRRPDNEDSRSASSSSDRSPSLNSFNTPAIKKTELIVVHTCMLCAVFPILKM